MPQLLSHRDLELQRMKRTIKYIAWFALALWLLWYTPESLQEPQPQPYEEEFYEPRSLDTVAVEQVA